MMDTLFTSWMLLAMVAADGAPVVSAARRDSGILIHEVQCAFQKGTTQIRVLLPDALRSEERLPVVYVLPVEAQGDARYGKGLVEIQTHSLHNKYRAIFVEATFSQLPWYADHPTDAAIRQEAYFLQVVVPFIDKTYPAQGQAGGRLLLGFSKSGWGAWSMLLRHPNTFSRAAAWDAPLMMDRLGRYGTTPIFGTPENFEKYQITRLLQERAGSLGSARRLILTGYGNFRQDHKQVHARLDELQIPHEYRDGPGRKHDWHSGWVEEAVELLLADRRTSFKAESKPDPSQDHAGAASGRAIR